MSTLISEIRNEIDKGEENIKRQLNTRNIYGNVYEKYGLINKSWFKKNRNNLINGKIKKITHKEIDPILDKKDYSYINSRCKFTFPCNFVFATQKFMNLLSNLAEGKDKKLIKNDLYEIIIGGECILMKDQSGESIYHYIILYKENEEESGNNIDYILIIKDYEKRKKEVNFIINKSIWKYLEKINLTTNDEYKDIMNDKMEIIGTITRNGELTRINELKELETKKKFNNQTTITKYKINLANKNSTVFINNNKSIIFSNSQINLVIICLYQLKDFITQLKQFSNNGKKFTKIFLENYEYLLKQMIIINH